MDDLALGSTSRRPKVVDSRRHRNAIICRAAQDKYGQCKCSEDAVMAIMKDAIQHCLNKECDTTRHKVLDQMGQGLAALFRVSVGVAAESNEAPIPIPVPALLSSIQDEDLERVRRMLQLTSLPFNNAYDEDLQTLMKLLQTGNGEEMRRTLSGSELAQICERLGSDLVQCLGPLVMCFPELPLWAKHRALLLPAEVAGKMAFSLLTGPNVRL